MLHNNNLTFQKPKAHILPSIIVAQFACTSLWFAGNAVVNTMPLAINAGSTIIGYILSSVQFGFIVGTLVFALFNIADRFSPSFVFLGSALLAAACNLALLIPSISIEALILARFGTGFFLAGIYPVGMKIASDYYQKGLGKALGFLVGALVLGTGFPHLLRSMETESSPVFVIQVTTGLAIFGGLVIGLFVPNGPYRKPASKLQLNAIMALFSIKEFRKAAFGYFGHMWELYAFWGFLPIILKNYAELREITFPISLWSFLIIAIGALSCIVGGYISLRSGSRKVAIISLFLSGILCLLSPLLFELPLIPFLAILLIWGMVVIADSPQFSTLVAASAPPELKGTGLTIVNCLGFAITIISIQLLSTIANYYHPSFIYLPLAIGPVLGLFALFRK